MDLEQRSNYIFILDLTPAPMNSPQTTTKRDKKHLIL